MQISWNGFSSFLINIKQDGVESAVVTDPFDNETGLRFPRTLTADTVCVTHAGADASNAAAVQGSPFVITIPGEYEIKGVFFFAKEAVCKSGEKTLLVRIEAEKMTIAHLGALDRPLTNEELEFLPGVDVVLIPIGGGRVMDAKVAAEVVNQIEPRVVIPMTYHTDGVKEKLAGVESFIKEIGINHREEANKYKFSKKDLPEEDTLLMILTR